MSSLPFGSIAWIVGRSGLASLFLLGGLNKLLNWGPTLDDMRAAGLEPAEVLLPLVVAMELGGGALVALGARFAWVAALLLAGFTLLTNVYFHAFWTMAGDVRALQLSLFFKNVAIAGGLVLAAVAMAERRRT